MNFLLFCAVILIIVLGLWLWHAQLRVKFLEMANASLEKGEQFWNETAAQHARNEDYYRGLVQRCGKVFGAAAYQCDDGVSVSQDILCAKVPELVEKLYSEFVETNDLMLIATQVAVKNASDTDLEKLDALFIKRLRAQKSIRYPEQFGPQPNLTPMKPYEPTH